MGSADGDFDDLYADLDDQVNGGIATVQDSCTGKDFDSVNEEYSTDELVGEPGEGERPMNRDDARGLVMEAESESEDDFRIVLNEEDCSNFGTSGRLVGWCEEEEDEDGELAVVSCFNHQKNSDQKRIQQLSNVDALVQGCAKRGSAAKHGWYVGPQVGGFPTKSVISMSGPREGDTNQLMVSCSGVSAPCNSCISPSGRSFPLPRKRTIFDIDIEALEKKPWRQQGVDTTDYFNFGLNEESWKRYCRNMDLLRLQAEMATEFPVIEPSRPTQMSYKNYSATESTQLVNGERDSGHANSLHKRLRWLQKGRAIQVEQGIGERIPSADLKRPRHRDSDVVIHVTMKDSLEDCQQEESQHDGKREIGSLESTSVDGLHEGVFGLEQNGQACSAILSSSESPRTNYERTAEAVATNPISRMHHARSDPSTNAYLLEAASPPATKDSNRNSSDSDSLSEASKYSGCSEKNFGILKKESMNSVTRLQESNNSGYYYSDGSRSNSTKSKEKDWELYGDGLIPSPENYRDRTRTRSDSMDEMVSPAFHEEAPVVFCRTNRKGTDKFRAGCRSEEKHSYGLDIESHLFFKDKTNRSRSYQSTKRHAENPLNGKVSTKASQNRKNDDITYKRNLDRVCSPPKIVVSDDNRTNSQNYWVDRVCSGPTRVASEDKRTNNQNLYKYYHDERVITGDACEDFDEPILFSDPFILEKDPNFRHHKVKMDQHHKIRNEHDKNAIWHRYREQNLPVMQGKHIVYNGEEGNLRGLSGMHVQANATELTNSKKRANTNISSCIDLNNTNWYNEYGGTDRRGLDGSSSPRDILAFSVISPEQYDDRKRSYALKDKQFRKKISANNCQSIKYLDHSSYKEDGELHLHQNRTERDFCVENMEFTKFCTLRRSKLHDDDDDGGVYHRHQGQHDLPLEGGPFNYVNNLRIEKSYENQHAAGSKKLITAESATRESRGDSRLVLNKYDKGCHDLKILEPREAVNLHVNGVKRKIICRGNPAIKTKRQAGNRIQKKAKKSRSKKGDYHQEIAFSLSKVGREHQQPVSSDAVIVAENKIHDVLSLEDDEIEEGQLIEEPDDQAIGLLKNERTKQKSVVNPSLVGNNNTSQGYDDRRILETLAKMEKRRERFKEPMAPMPVDNKSQKLQVEVATVTEEVKQQRPVRKRRWGASS